MLVSSRPIYANFRSELLLAGDVCLNVSRCDARRGQPFGLDLLLDLVVCHCPAPAGRLSVVRGVSMPCMGDAPSSGTGGNWGLVFWLTSGAAAACSVSSGPSPW